MSHFAALLKPVDFFFVPVNQKCDFLKALRDPSPHFYSAKYVIIKLNSLDKFLKILKTSALKMERF